jgi:hypothetical protein
MRQIDPGEIESPEEQEVRARRRLRPKAMLICALIVGVIIFVVPSGGPWMSQEGFISAMGRLLAKSVWVNVVVHFILALIYGWIVAACIYSLKTAGGIVAGAAISLPLYGINYLIFASLLRYHSSELHVFLAHFTFCLFFAAAYKAASVPAPRWKATGQPVEARDRK